MTIIQKLVDLISIISTDYNMECISTRNRFTRRQGEYINEAVYKLRNDSPNIKIISNILYNIINDQKNVQTLDYCCKLLLSSYNLIEQKIYDLLIKLKTAKLQGDAIKYQQMSTNSGVTLDTVMSKINQSGLFTEHPNNIDDALDKLIIHIKDLQSQNNNMLTLSNAQKAMEGVNPVDWSTENFQENTEKISKLSRLASERRPSGFINGPRIDLDDLGGMMSGHALNPHQSIFGTQLGTEFNPRNQGKRHPYSKDTPSIWSDSPQAWPSHPGQRQSSSAGSGT